MFATRHAVHVMAPDSILMEKHMIITDVNGTHMGIACVN